jgi:hypothetical protein
VPHRHRKAGTIGVGGSIGIAEKSIAVSNTREVRVGIGICETRRAIAARLYTRTGGISPHAGGLVNVR